MAESDNLPVDAALPSKSEESAVSPTPAYRALAESEKKYRTLFNFMPIAMWQLDARRMRQMIMGLREAGIEDLATYFAEHPEFLEEAEASLRVTEANERTLHLFGATDREELLRAMPDLWLTGARDWVAAAKAREGGAKFHSAESSIRRMDGSIAEIMYSVAFADPDDPDGLHVVGAVDISEERRAKRSLEESERMYRYLFQYMPVSLWQTDSSKLVERFNQLREEGVTDLEQYLEAHPEFLDEGVRLLRIQSVNERTVEMLGGTTPADFVSSIERFWEINAEAFRQNLIARFKGKESVTGETKLNTFDGRVIDVFYTAAFPLALNERGISVAGVLDITDRTRAERQLRQLEADFAHASRVATLGELTASIAHEVNQPLAAIITNGEASLRWLSKAEPDVEKAKEIALDMIADARRASDVMTRIRSMAAGAMPAPEVVPVNAAIGEAVNFLGRELRDHHVQVELALSEDEPSAVADRTQLQQVLVNLIVNAVHAMADKPFKERRIVLRTALLDQDTVEIEVDDRGVGFRDAETEKIFDSFYTTKKNGLGIGLSICRSIVEAHGGSIRAANSSNGAKVSFTLPAARSDAQPVA
ncbi:MAG TPA: ATP-binding protein [Sphingomicrobium sp.]|nr:ATP-binding protein [Sphingomicrobium sp.]